MHLILVGFVFAVRPGKELIRQLTKEKFDFIYKILPYSLVPGLLQEAVAIFPGKRCDLMAASLLYRVS